jgi:hypothetical protein
MTRRTAPYLAATWLVTGCVAAALATAAHGDLTLALLLGMAFGFPATVAMLEWLERGK